jgi:hypothetical protein
LASVVLSVVTGILCSATCYLGNDSFAAIRCNVNVISGPLLNNGRLALAPLFRLSCVISEYVLTHYELVVLFTATIQIGLAVIFQSSITEVLGSNLGMDAGYRD